LHANRTHLAAREEGLDLGVEIAQGGEVGRRATILRRGHAENEGGGARVVSGERDGEVRTTMAQQNGRARAAVAPPMMALAIWVLVAVSGPGCPLRGR
jgi:hypothetical protein